MAAERQAKTDAPERERRLSDAEPQPQEEARAALAVPVGLHAPPSDGPPPALRRQALLRLQRQVGNHQVQRQLQRRSDPFAAPQREQLPEAQPDSAPVTALSQIPVAPPESAIPPQATAGGQNQDPASPAVSAGDAEATPTSALQTAHAGEAGAAQRGNNAPEQTGTNGLGASPAQVSEAKAPAPNAGVAVKPLELELKAPPQLEGGPLTAEALELPALPGGAPTTPLAPAVPQLEPVGGAGPQLAAGPPAPTAAPLPMPPQLDGLPLQRMLASGSQIQRDEDGGGGLLSGIRQRISGVVDGLRSGWSSLTSAASEAFAGVQGQLGGLLDGLRSGVSEAMSGVQGTFADLQENARQLTAGLEQQVSGSLDAVTGIAQTIGQAVLNLDAAALSAAWARLSGLLSGAWQQAQQAGQALYQRITGLWEGVRGRFDGALSAISGRMREGFNRVRAAAQDLRQRLAGTWEGLRNRAGELSGVLGGVLDRLRSLVSRLLSWGEQVWGSIQEQWAGLRERVAGMVAQVQTQVGVAWEEMKAQAGQLWGQIGGLWGNLQQSVRQQVTRLGGRLGELWESISGFNIGQLIETVTRYAPLLKGARDLAENPDSVLQPLAQGVVDKLQGGMPDAANQEAHQHAGQGGAQAEGTTAPQAAPQATVQRQTAPANASAGALNPPVPQGLLWSVFLEVVKEKWSGIKLLPTVRAILHDSIYLWESLPREWHEMTAELGRAVDRMNSAGLGFWRHLLDIPLIIWRRANNMLTHLFPLFALLMTVLGAVAGGVGGAFGGAVLGFFAGGVGAAPGAAGGGAVGIAGGAGAGFGFAMGIGEGLLGSYVAAELLSFLKAYGDLSLVDQTEQEQIEDLDQMAGSAIGLGIAAVLLALSALAARFAEGLLGGLKPGSVAQRFFAGMNAGFRRGSPFRRGPAAPRENTPGQQNPGQETPGQQTPGQQNPGQETPGNRTPSSTELPPEEVTRLVAERNDGSFRLNRKRVANANKIVGEPEARVAEHAAREAFAAERAANMNNVERVYMGREADQIINPNAPPGTEMSADVVGVTRQGKYVLIEAKGTEILHGLEQLEHSAQQLGAAEVVRYELVVAEEIRTPGFTIENRILHLNGKLYTINGKPVHVRTTISGR